MSLNFSKLKVLLVEDTEPMRKLMASVLLSLGVKHVDAVGSAEEGMRKFLKENHDIILTDWKMEPVDGIDFTCDLRSNTMSPNRQVPVILVTGYSALQRIGEARDAGVTEFLVKPFTANDLARRLAYVINKPRDFVETQDFFGPSRRRRRDPNHTGPNRRKDR